jgi:hypothetical protein
MQQPRPAPIQRVLSRAVEQADGCLLYQGAARRNGYAYVYVGRDTQGRKRQRGVHVVVLEEKIGRRLDPGVMALHTCDVKLCVNRDHLYAGTHADNMRDRDERGRTTRGEDKPEAKLTWVTVTQARQLREAGATYAELAQRFGVSTPTIWKAVTGRTWRTDAGTA